MTLDLFTDLYTALPITSDNIITAPVVQAMIKRSVTNTAKFGEKTVAIPQVSCRIKATSRVGHLPALSINIELYTFIHMNHV